MPLTLYNSLTRKKERFQPLDPARVRMYVCGPTVYDRAHIGNARAVVVFDQLYRLLREEYGAEHVVYVRNITDVEDKIIDAARERGEPIAALTARTTAAFHEDMVALGTLPPSIEPRATEYIREMIALIERLIAAGHAYEAQGHVLFSVATAADYGKLARRSREEMLAGARVEVAPYKRDPGDFVLWKPSPPDLPGWDSPWGRGRPGWHIECSAMSEANLGESFDIHGGGLDLIFPHHENEIAQSEGAHGGHVFARVWMHNEMLTVDGVKMSKSLGNIVTVREVLEKGAPGEAVRLALLSTHYRDPLDWTDERLRQARAALDRFYRALALPVQGEVKADLIPAMVEPLMSALEDDLNTPRAISEMHALARQLLVYDHPRSQEDGEAATRQEVLRKGGYLLGLLSRSPLDWLRGSAAADAQRIEARIAERAEARRARRFAEADRIRAALAEEGILLEDKPDGTTTWWRKD